MYLIALNLIVLDFTGSPFAVSLLYILIPVTTLFTNFWAGSFIDRLNKRNLMISLDLIRAILILPFHYGVNCNDLYVCVFLNIASSDFRANFYGLYD